jgi:hypothetical protein
VPYLNEDKICSPLFAKGFPPKTVGFLLHPAYSVNRFMAQTYLDTYFKGDLKFEDVIKQVMTQADLLEMAVEEEEIDLAAVFEDSISCQLYFYFHDCLKTIYEGEALEEYGTFVKSLKV